MNLRVLFCLWYILIFRNHAQDVFESDESGYTFINKVRFPFSSFYDPFMGLIIAFDIKLVPSAIDADLSWNMEANYFLPQNESEYSFPPIIPAESSERGLFDRSMIYRMLELKLDSFSKHYGGENCFLHILCQISCFTPKDTDVLGDIIHIILSPTSSLNKNLPLKYIHAQNYGRKNKHCKKYNRKCPIDFLSYFSVIGELHIR